MRSILYLCLFSVLVSCKSSEKADAKTVMSYAVLGQLTQTSQHCGGMRPSPEMEQELRTPKPYQLKLYLRKDSVNRLETPIIQEIMPDAEGKFELKLAPGTYCIVREWQLKEADPASVRKADIQVKEDCFREKWTECFKSFEVVDTSVDLGAMNIKHRCFLPDFPCIRFTGPMPP